MKNTTQHVFIIGSKGIPSNYGGFESFVDRLTYYRKSDLIKYHVACVAEPDNMPQVTETEYNGAHCFTLSWKKLGPARAIVYDLEAMQYCISYIKKHNISEPLIYVLACRIGPFFRHYVKKIHKLGGKVYVNPDGHEWKRAKWSAPVRKYWKFSERLMVKSADYLICDSKNIERYIHEDYKQYNPKTTFIAYGAELTPSVLVKEDEKLTGWYDKHGVRPYQYYLSVGRFVPENNFETMIKGFMASDTDKDFVLITNVENNGFYEELLKKTGLDGDKRIKFVGTVYDKELLKKIREQAYGYFHGHEVGGTNPSLLESLGSTDLNLLLNVGFNREVGEDGAIYWDKSPEALAQLIQEADRMSTEDIAEMGRKAKLRISTAYSWDYIVECYENVFLQAFD